MNSNASVDNALPSIVANRHPIAPYPGDAYILHALEQSGASLHCDVWEEAQCCVVLGKGCQLERDVHLAAVDATSMPIYRREGGGGTVVLSPGMLVVAVAAHVREPYGNSRFFALIQQPIIETLNTHGITPVQQRGLSDLAWHHRKILGSSLRRQRSLLLYQGVLLVDVDRSVLAQYLQHPPKEPDYRQGRSHEQFTVSLREIGLQTPLLTLQQDLQHTLSTRLPELLAADLL